MVSFSLMGSLCVFCVHPYMCLAFLVHSANIVVLEEQKTTERVIGMSTNCIIAYEKKDKSIEGIRCHWDGYPEGVGQTLLNHYDDEKTKKLI